jgi:hypothetical protein
MPEPTTALLEGRLDAWARAELHTASKALPGPPPGFTNAVAAEARYQRTLNHAILLALLVLLITLGVVAYFRANPPAAPADTTAPAPAQPLPLTPLSPHESPLVR